MANAGTTGGDWERLESQLSATRSDVAAIAGAVSGLTELVTDLVRRSSTEHQDERWQARLGSLETRLGMLETAIRSEVERMRATAGTVDALADDFRTTVGGTRNFVDLAETISDRIGALQSLERQVRGAAEAVAASVDARLSEDAAARTRDSDALATRVEGSLAERVSGVLERLDALADVTREQGVARDRLDAIDRAIQETRQSLADVAGRLDGVSSATAELPAIEERLAGRMQEASAWGDRIDQIRSQVSDLHSRLDGALEGQTSLSDVLSAVSGDIARMRGDLDATNQTTRNALSETIGELTGEVRGIASQLAALSDTTEDDARLREIASALAQVRAQQPHLALRLDQLATDLSAVRSGLGDPDAEHAVIVERIDGLAAAMRTLVASFPDTRPQLEELSNAVAQLGDTQPQTVERFDRLTSEIEQLRAAIPGDNAHRLDHLAREIEQLRGAIPDDTAVNDRITFLLDEQATTLLELRAAHPQQAERLERIATDIAALQAYEPPRVELGPLFERIDRLAIQINDELLAARERVPEVAVDLEPMLVRLDTVADQLTQLRSTQPNTENVLTRIATLLNEHSAALTQLQSSQPQLAVRLDQLAVDLAELSELARPPEGPDPAVEHIERLAADIAALRESGPVTNDDLLPLREQVAALLDAVTAPVEPPPDLRPALDQLARAFAALRTDLSTAEQTDATQAVVERIDQLSERIDQIVAVVTVPAEPPPDLGPAFDQLHAALETIRTDLANTSQADTTAALAERLDQLTTEVALLRESGLLTSDSLTPLYGRLDHLLDAAAAPTEPPPDVRPALDQLANVVASLRTDLYNAAQADPAAPVLERIDALAGRLAESTAPDTTVVDTLQQIREAVHELQSRQVELTPHLAQLTTSTADLLERHPELSIRLDQVQAELADLRARTPDPAAAVAPVLAQLDGLAAQLAALPTTASGLDEVAAELAALRAQQPEPGALDRTLEQAVGTRIDRITAELVALRADQPDLAPVADALSARLDEVGRSVDAVMSRVSEPPAEPTAPLDVSLLLEPLTNQLSTIDARAVATSEAVASVEAAVSRATTQLDDITTQLATLRDTPDETAFALAPVIDRLAIVVDSVSSLHGDVASLADSLSALRNERAQLVQLTMEANGRLDLLSANIAELRQVAPDVASYHADTNEHIAAFGEQLADLRANRPDFTASFLSVTELVDSVQSNINALHQRIDAVVDLVRQTDAPTVDVEGSLAPLLERLSALAVDVAALHTAAPDLGGSLAPVLEQLAAVEARIASLPAPADVTPALATVEERLNAISSRIGELLATSPDLSASLTPVLDQLAGIDSRIATLPGPLDITPVLATLDQSLEAIASRIGDIHGTLADTGGGFATVSMQIEGVQTAVRHLHERMETLAAEGDGAEMDVIRDQVTGLTNDVRASVRAVVGLGADITGLRNDIEQLAAALPDPATERTGIVDQVRADVGGAVSAVDDALHVVHDDVRSTRNELEVVRRMLDQVRDELARAQDREMAGGAAALVASAAAAMARLEVRFDGEFDGVGRQMEAVGTLLAQAIEAIHRIEAQIVGAHPGSERMRASAASVLDSLRTNVRQRAARRSSGPPAELGSGQ